MERRLPPDYRGWQDHEASLRRMTTPELIQEIQDGPPDRRLAALSVIDLSEVDLPIIQDWIRTLPDAEANELAGAIPVQRPHASCDEDLRWVNLARTGYEVRRLPTFLVMLFSSLEAMESRQCPQRDRAWDAVGEWLGDIYDRLADKQETEALDDISLFVFENYLGHEAIFEAFCGLLVRQQPLARRVSTNPSLLLSDLDEAHQRKALQEAEAGGGLPFRESWRLLQGL
ncbi:MAG: hypothetical protein LC118_14705 [Dehalococcoidia bacterium]|nr:hypothetical protein [Dehalococcoidia bacterium]